MVPRAVRCAAHLADGTAVPVTAATDAAAGCAAWLLGKVAG